MAALYLLAGRKLRQDTTLLGYTLPVYGTAALSLGLMALVWERTLWPMGDLGSELTLFLLLAVVSQLLGHTMYNWSLRHLPAHLISLSLLGEPIGAGLLAFFFLGQVPTLWLFLGAIPIAVGFALAALAWNRSHPG
jgi:drug/metabolite transporter (DMT)-like permease